MSSVMNTAQATGAGFSQQINAVRDVYSAEIFFSALPILKFDQFTTKKTELGVQPGTQIQMPRYGNIKRGGKLTEGDRMKTQAMSLTQQAISVDEYGNAIGFSERLLNASFYDQLAAASMLLGRDLAIVLDLALRDMFAAAVNVIYASTATDRSTIAATFVFTTREIKDAVEALETNNAPKWGGDHYIGFIHPHQARGLRDDAAWINASLYSGAAAIYTGEIGRFEDVRFVTSTVMPNGANNTTDPATGEFVDPGYDATLRNQGVGSAVNIYKAVIFGEFAVGHATSLPVELRDNGGSEDYGREHGLAWYSIWGQGRLENKNLVVIETA